MRTLIRSAAAAALAVAAGLAWAPPASAAACPSADGVTVVVDLARSGGSGTTVSCVGDGGGKAAAALFNEAGHTLTRVSSQPGAVCKVDGYRTQDACQRMPPGNAFWGLFWADGDGGWVFSQEGVDGLNVPEGGSVAWAWQNGGGYDYPSVGPAQHDEPTQEPSPSQPPTGGNGGGSSGGASGGATGGSDGAGGSTPSSDPTADDPTSAPAGGDRDQRARAGQGERDPEVRGKQGTGDRKGKGDRDKAATDDPIDEATDGTDDETDEVPTAAEPPMSAGDDALPVWVGPSAVGGVLGLAGLAAYLRRRAA